MQNEVVADRVNVHTWGELGTCISRAPNQHFFRASSKYYWYSYNDHSCSTNMSTQTSRSKTRSSPITPTPVRKQPQSAAVDKGTGKKRRVADENELEPNSDIDNHTAKKKKRKVRTTKASTPKGSSHTISDVDGGTPAARGDRNSDVEQSEIAEQFAIVKGQHRFKVSQL